ncbi:MAG: hypothetical protein Q8P13_03845 [bacterium]|nr:hypothetical protein [bacterium]
MPEEITTPSPTSPPQTASSKKLDLKKTLITTAVIAVIAALIGGALFWYTWNVVNQEDKGASIKQATNSASKSAQPATSSAH